MNKYAEADLERIDRDRDLVYSMPLEDIDPSDRHLFQENTMYPYFERLRAEDPVHYHERSFAGPYWSVTRYEHIRQVDAGHKHFSAEPSITFQDHDDATANSFIAMDQPRHDEQRKAVAPVTGPRNLAKLESLIRSRAVDIIDNLPVGEVFNWVGDVSVELTSRMLATLFDFPYEDRHQLIRWSDVVAAPIESGLVESDEQRERELEECYRTFKGLWDERKADPSGDDLVSMLLRNEDTRNMPMEEFYGNLMLLIIGGNDTTRNSISGGVLALNQYPDELPKVQKDRSLIPNMVAEIIRWQTPVIYIRRTAHEDVELGGKQIKKGDKVVMWYVSGNRDTDVFDSPHSLRIDRQNARAHLSFGFGIHRCMGNRLAEMQLRVLWEELLQREITIELAGEPERGLTNIVRSYRDMPVQISRG